MQPKDKNVLISHRFWNLSVVTSLILVGIILIIVALLGIIASRSVNDVLNNERTERLHAATVASDRFDDLIRDAFDELNSEVQEASVVSLTNDKDVSITRTSLLHVFKEKSYFWSISLVDPRGNTIFVIPQEKQEAWESIKSPWINTALAKRDRHIVDSPIQAPSGATALLALVKPFKPGEGTASGSIIGLIDLSSPLVQRIVTTTVYGQTSYTTLLNSDGTIVASSNSGRLFKKSHISDSLTPVLGKGKPVIMDAPDDEQPSGAEVVVLAPLKTGPLIFTLEQDKREFEAPLFIMRRRFITAGIIIVVVGIAGSTAAVRLLGKPLHQLSNSVRQIAAGDLQSKVPISGVREFSELGLAFEDMREQIERNNNELSMLLKIEQIISRDLRLDDVVKTGLKLALETIKADCGGFHMVADGDKLVLAAYHGISEQLAEALAVLQTSEGIAGQVIARRQPVSMDVSEYPSEHLARILANEGIKKLISAPLIVGDKIIGTVGVGRKSSTPFLERDINLLTSVVSQLAIAFEKARLTSELAQRSERRTAMGRITTAISKSLNIESIYATLVVELPKLAEYDRLSVAELKGELLELSVVSRDISRYLAKGTIISPDNKMFYDVIREGKPVIRYNLEKEAVQPIDRQLLAAGIHSVILIPLVAGGRTFGSLNLGSNQINNYSEADLEYLQPVADQLAIALDNARLFMQIEAVAGEWRTTFDAMEEGVAIISPDLRIQRANRSIAEMAGTTPQSLLGQHCYSVFHGRNSPLPECPGISCLVEKRPCEIIREEPPHGNRWFQMRAYPMLDADGQVISLIHTIRNITKEKQQRDDIEKVYHVSQLLSTTLELDTVIGLALGEVLSIVGEPVSTSCIALLDDTRKQATIVAAQGLYQDMLKDFSMPLSVVPEDIVNILFVETKPWVVRDASGLPSVIKAIPGADKFQSFVVLPMVRGNQTVGLLFAGSIKSWTINSEQLLLLENCTRQVTLAVENARLYTHMGNTLSRRVNELQTLTDVLNIATQSLDLITIIRNALKRAAQSMGVERGSIVVPDASGKKVVVLAIWQEGEEKRVETGSGNVLTDNPMWQKVLVDGQYVVTEDTELIPNEKRRELLKQLGIRSALIVPLKISGRIIGSIQFNTTTGPRSYTLDEISMAQAIAGHFAYIIENAQLYERTEKERGTLQAIISSMREGLVVVDANHNITYCNQSAEEILDIQAKNVIGLPEEVFGAAWMGRVSESGKLGKQWAEMFTSRTEQPRTEFELLSKGSRRMVESLIFPIKNEQSVLGTGLLFRDITREREIDRMKTEFVSIASHELRTPMTVIYGFTELLLRTKTLPPEQQEWVERIYKESQRLTTIVDDFLNVTRIESGRLSLHMGPVSVQPIATQLVNQLCSNYRSHSFRIDIPPDFPEVMADTDRLTQVLYNLIDNAAKYSPEGGPVVILARTADDGKQALISVSDKGLGIPPDEMPRLFTRFHRIHRPEANTIRGTGLGLSIVKAIVEFMNGRVWAESKVSEGSTFYIALPLADNVSSYTGENTKLR